MQVEVGTEDEKGAANHLTPQLALEAAKLVKTGKVYQLGVETNSKTPAYPPRTFGVTILQPGQTGGTSLGPTKTTYNDDIITGWVGVGSQLDGLGHIGVDNVYYNCNKAADFAAADGLKKLGIEKVPAFVTRGVVLDMTAVTGQNPVPAGTPFNKKEIDDALAKQGIQIKKGDVVLFHTGWQDMASKDAKAFSAGERGSARRVPNIWSRKRSWPSVPISGVSRSCPSRRVWEFSRSTRFCCRETASTF